MSEYRRIPVRGSKEIYYADLMAPAEAFSNEWDKYLLLNILNEFRSVYEFELYAFCILNDRLMLLAGSYRLKASTVRSMLSGLAERYLLRTEQIGEYGLLWPGSETRAGIVRIDDEQDAISVMRYIHLMPASQGYSLSAADYWWTSFSSYRGRYCWPMVDAGVVMQYLEQRDPQAARSLMEYHRRAEFMKNPVPECIKNIGYSILTWNSPYEPQEISEENLNETFGA